MSSLDGPFRGSRAIAAGVLTRRVLRGSRYRRLFPDVYVAAHVEVDLALRSRAAYLLVEGRGMVAGYSAAELLGASCARPDAPAEVLMGPGHQRHSRTGLRVHRDTVWKAEAGWSAGVLLTTAARTAFDLARWAPDLTERVVAVDALAYGCGVTTDAVRALARDHLGAHHTRGIGRVLGLVDGRAESPMESRIRMALVLDGLPTPVLQHPVVCEGRAYYLDLAYPELKLAIEYDGSLHRTQLRAHRDLRREADLTRLGWTVLRFDAHTVLQLPSHVAAQVRAELRRRGMAVA